MGTTPLHPHIHPKSLNIRQLQEKITTLEKSNERLVISHELTQEFVGQVKSVKYLINLVFERVLETLDAEAGSFWLVDKPNNQNICHLAEGPGKKNVLGLRLPNGKGILGAVINSQIPDIILDCSKDARFFNEVDARSGFTTHSMICVPLVIDNETYGAIQILNKKNRVNSQFDEDDRKLVLQLAAGASLSMKNARLLEMESRVNEMNALMSISKEIVSTLDLDQVLDYVVNRANELVDITGAAVALYDERKSQLLLMALSGEDKVDPKDDDQLMLIQLMEQVLKSGRSAYVANITEYKKTLSNGDNLWVNYIENKQLNAVWAMPLEDEEGALGVIFFEAKQIGFANGSKADLLHILASQTTVALRNASLFKNIPLSNVLSQAGEKSRYLFSLDSWKKKLIILSLISTLLLSLHYLPIFRWVSGTAIVEAQLGQGIFLPLEGQIKHIFVKESQLLKKGQLIAQLDNRVIKLNLLEYESQLALLERQIVEARAESDALMMNNAAIEREAVRAKVLKARADLLEIDIKAPIDGLVLTPKPQELKGRVFAMGDEIIRLADPKKLVLLVHIPEIDLLDIEIGQAVKCVLRAQPGLYFTGRVRHVGQSYEIPNTILDASVELENEESKTGFIAEVEILNPPYEIRPGMTGQALIQTEKTSALVRIWRRISNFIAFNLGL